MESSKDEIQAGTGFMLSLSTAINHLSSKGYVENLVPKFDHLECQQGNIRLDPSDIQIDKIVRFENTSDPDDQSILFAISSRSHGIKGLYADSYGLYHDVLSPEMMKVLSDTKVRRN